ncbi:hypothetical protein MMC25_007911 [Agyrium rufum]|nr:hypothetical protein [Agyrium rufum]
MADSRYLNGWIDDYKLPAELIDGSTVHETYVSDRRRHQRKVKVIRQWSRKQRLGRNKHQPTWLEEEEEGDLRVVKTLRAKTKDGIPDYRQEVIALARLGHNRDAFPEFYGWYESGDKVYLAVEYFECGNLESCIGDRLDEAETQQIATQLLEGLEILHWKGFTHSLAAGLSTPMPNQEKATNLNLAPEQLQLTKHLDDGHEHAANIWSVGCIMISLLTGKSPFSSKGQLMEYCKDPRVFTGVELYPLGLGEETLDFLRRLIDPEPARRPTATSALQHPWLHVQNEAPMANDAELNGRANIAETHRTASNMSTSAIENPREDLEKNRETSNRNSRRSLTTSAPKPSTVVGSSDLPTMTMRGAKGKIVGSPKARKSAFAAVSTNTDETELPPAYDFVASGTQVREKQPQAPSELVEEAKLNLGKEDAAAVQEMTTIIDHESYANLDIFLNQRQIPIHSLEEALQEAAKRGQAGVAQVLLTHGAGVNSANAEFETPLWLAIQAGSYESVQVCLLHNADINHSCETIRRTPLHLAIDLDQLEITKLLCVRGAGIDLVDRDGRSPLWAAVQNGGTGFVSSVLNLHPLIERQDFRYGWTPLFFAVEQDLIEVGSLLLAHAANGNLAQNDQDTPRFAAVRRGNATMVQNFVEKSDLLLDARSPSSGLTPLMAAAKDGLVDVVESLLACGARMDLTDKRGRTAFLLAVEHGHDQCVRRMLRADRLCAKRTMSDGTPPIFIAIEASNVFAVRILLNNACGQMHNGTYVSAIHKACAVGNIDVVKTLVEHRRSFVYERDGSGNQPLYVAIMASYEPVVRYLLGQGVNPNRENASKQSAWMLAVLGGSLELTKLVLTKTTPTIQEVTHARHVAIDQGFPDIAQWLSEEEVRKSSKWTRRLGLKGPGL